MSTDSTAKKLPPVDADPQSSSHRPAPAPPVCDDRKIWDIWMSVYHFPTLTLADEVGLFPLVAEQPSTESEITERLNLSLRGTRALLGVMTSLGLLVQHQGKFHLTETSREYLLPESPYYYGGLLQGFRERIVSHQGLRESLMNDRPVAHDGGEEFSDQWRAGTIPDDRALALTRLMHSHSFPAAFGVARRGNFEGIQRLLDVGGGSGAFCIACALSHPDVSFTIMELAPVCAIANDYISSYGLSDRIATMTANMFVEDWPRDHDGVFLSNILHDWDMASCKHLLEKAHAALEPGGGLYIHEMLLEDTHDAPLTTATFSMLMLSDTQGQQFTAPGLTRLIADCGFESIQVAPTYSYYSLVTATKAA